MTDRRNALFQLLLELPKPSESLDGEWQDYKALGLSESDVPGLIALMSDESLNCADGNGKEVWVPLHSWRALAQLRSIDALAPLLDLRDRLGDDDWLNSDLVLIPSMIGKESLPILADFLQDIDRLDYSRANVGEAISQLGNTIPEIKPDCKRVLSGLLEKFDHNRPELNGFIVWSLLDLDALDCLDTIRHVYLSGAVEIGICGDLEDVEIKLGARKERSTPKPQYYNFPKEERFGDSFPMVSTDTPYHRGKKVGRNEPCPCGSGKKYKKCCMT